eukprot:CAMPEP_0177602438 /NCGR_PEP_ID=MMETSP0419_2-20121207/14864_1 /TAXON_ID=582737 /ORGANISM="Tetraselmis sp., Strain GSL018" /LENGTH=167 /DNA_ID=CAMNT_0019095913 /DNA_START=368 /DNA_END=868 /DNA_ORIENTATION=-
MKAFQAPKAERKPDPATLKPSPFLAGKLPQPRQEFASLAVAVHNANTSANNFRDEVGGGEYGERASPGTHWKLAADSAMARTAAKKIWRNNKIRSLQRTPLHTIVNRLRQLVERRDALMCADLMDRTASPGKPAARGNPKGLWRQAGRVASPRDLPSSKAGTPRALA